MPLARAVLVFGSLFLTASAIPSPNPNARSSAATRSSTPQAATLSPAALQVAQVRNRWAQLLNSKQLGPLMNLYTPDAVFLQPTGQRLNGAPAIRAVTQKIWTMINPNISLHSVTTKASGNLAYDEGDFRETLTSISNGATQQSEGSYLMIFKRDAHGRWLIAEQVWTGLVPNLK